MTTTTTSARTRRAGAGVANPWPALWAMVVGFFMILVDSTIVAVANPSIMTDLNIGYDTVIWVTSGYLLAYAVPLLVAGRLGDRFGPRNLYLIGLAVFTVASLWCGLSGSIEMLIAARVVQGLGAALLTPQTLSTITRIFPADRRGVAMSVWGATAGVATLIGPLAGGVLVDALGWEWIFFINVPIGIIGLGLAAWLIPELPTQNHRFDLIGVTLSSLGVFLLVFALQEGQSHHWQPWIWAVIVAGIGLMTAFVYWQSMNRGEPLIPLHIFTDRNFSVANLAVAVIGFVSVAMMFPVMFYAQGVCGLSPTRSALLTAPTAIASGLLAPLVGKIVDRVHPRPVVGFGFSVLAVGVTWLALDMTPTTPIWRLVVIFAVIGVGMAFIWSPLAATATRNLPPELAGAGSGVFNATRQFGTVLGSAGMAAFMTWRLTAEMPAMPEGGHGQDVEGAVLRLPDFLHDPFSAAMSQATLLPAFIALFGVVAALFMVGFGATVAIATVRGRPGAAGTGLRFRTGRSADREDDLEDFFEEIRGADSRAGFGEDFRGASLDDQAETDEILAGRWADDHVAGPGAGVPPETFWPDPLEPAGGAHLSAPETEELVALVHDETDTDRLRRLEAGPDQTRMTGHNGARLSTPAEVGAEPGHRVQPRRTDVDTDELFRVDRMFNALGQPLHEPLDDPGSYGRHARRERD